MGEVCTMAPTTVPGTSPWQWGCIPHTASGERTPISHAMWLHKGFRATRPWNGKGRRRTVLVYDRVTTLAARWCHDGASLRLGLMGLLGGAAFERLGIALAVTSTNKTPEVVQSTQVAPQPLRVMASQANW